MIFLEYLEKIENYIRSGDLAFEFEHAEGAQRGELLDFLERIMDLGEECDPLATKLIFPNADTGSGDDQQGASDQK